METTDMEMKVHGEGPYEMTVVHDDGKVETLSFDTFEEVQAEQQRRQAEYNAEVVGKTPSGRSIRRDEGSDGDLNTTNQVSPVEMKVLEQRAEEAQQAVANAEVVEPPSSAPIDYSDVDMATLRRAARDREIKGRSRREMEAGLRRANVRPEDMG